MNEKSKKNKKKLLIRIGIGFLCFIVAVVIAFFIWAADFYHADEVALSVLEQSNVADVENTYVVTPQNPSDSLFIFYPGAKVEPSAYLPLMDKIANETGMTCVIVKMPLNFAFFDINAAGSIIARYPEAKTVYMAGHSLGGSMASDFASNNENIVDGVIVMGSFVYGDFPQENALTIYGSLDSGYQEHLENAVNGVLIEGGNHAQYGNYGQQSGDSKATISSDEQQNLTAQAIADFVQSHEEQ